MHKYKYEIGGVGAKPDDRLIAGAWKGAGIKGCCCGMPCGGGFHPSGINGIAGFLPFVPMIKGCFGATAVDPLAGAVAPLVQSKPE